MFFLFFVGIVAGLIEATAGGSGLISLPALMFLGYQPIEAIATSKFQFAFGSLAAITRFERAGLIQWRSSCPMLAIAAIAGGLGAYVLSITDLELVAIIVPVLLFGAAIYFMLSPRISDEDARPRIRYKIFMLSAVPLIAFYDGFFGVGSASLYMMAFVLLLGRNVRDATANTKLVDFASGVAALIVLALKGHVLLLPGLILGAGQIIGGYCGASLVLRWGARWVRPVIVLVTIGLSVNLLLRQSAGLLRLMEMLSKTFQTFIGAT